MFLYSNKLSKCAKFTLIIWLILAVVSLPRIVLANTTDDPCGGPSALLNLVDRPTHGDSVCVVPFKNVVLELGAQYQAMVSATNYADNYPQTELRIGLPAKNEFFLLLPNYTHQSMTPYTGFSAIKGGIKHGIGYANNWMASVETLLTLPSGTNTFGNNELGVAFNGIVNYSFNPSFNITYLLGISNESQSTDSHRYTSINPDVVLTYVYNPKVNFFGEVYGQSKTAANMGSGFDFDAGVVYLLVPKFAIDLEIGHRISGSLGNFDHYLGAGIAAEF